MQRSLLTLSSALVFSATAGAQDFNLDVGAANAANGGGAPASTYGAAANQPGTWFEIDSTPMQNQSLYTTPALVDTTGATTGVTADFVCLNTTDFFTNLDANQANTFGDDELLMDNIMYCVGQPYTITFNGLAPGAYEVYTYAMAPDSATLFSDVDVPLGMGGLQTVGGAFPTTGHALGITYALHTYTVTSNGMLEIFITSNGSDDSLNGIQLVTNASGSLGTSYCGPANPNSTGMSATITAIGSAFAMNNDVTLNAANLPQNQFGYFLNSMTQGFVQNPGGSQGNLCLGGQIGRYNANIFNSGAGGSGSLMLDLPNTPTPSGTTAIMAGETWNFTCWFRDNNPGPTSNFTQGVSVPFQ